LKVKVNSGVTEVRFSVNGQPIKVMIPGDVPRKTTLLTYLRENLNLTGAKDGCSQRGECGACSVIVDGQARKSCLLLLERLNGAKVETIEGLAHGEKLHPLQWAFAEEGAVECGFCTPGFIMVSKALLDQNPGPSREKIVKTLSGNLCRCGMYQQMIPAIQKASAALQEKNAFRPIRWPESQGPDWIGIPFPRMDAQEKVTGRALYGQDLKFRDMLYAVPVLSSEVHGALLSVDEEPAIHSPGVVTVLTEKDIPGIPSRGVITPDWPVFAKDRVRFTGEVIAVVIARALDEARSAAKEVRVEYRPLPVISDPEEALSGKTPRIHPKGNLCNSQHITRGDVEEGMGRAYWVLDQVYTTQFAEHAYLETETGVGTYSEKEGLTIYTGGHDSEANRMELARMLNLPEERIRIIRPYVGGSFGGKREISIHTFLALGAIKTGRPVKMVLNRNESMRISTKRHPMKMHFVTGFSKEGRIISSKMEIIADGGAYSSESEPVLKLAVGHCTGPYYIPNLEIQGKSVFTNNVVGGAMRGYGFLQVNFAMESQLDIAARKLRINPVEIRRINALRKGGPTSYGQLVDADVSLIPCLEMAYKRAREAFSPPPEGWKAGIGLAGLWKTTGISHGRDPGAEARIEITPEGIAVIRVNCHEFGQGTTGGIVQIAAQTLGLPLNRIQMISCDTSLVPKGGPGIASRQTFVLGMAVFRAAEELKEKIMSLCAEAGIVRAEGGIPPTPWDGIYGMAEGKGISLESSFRLELPPAGAIPEDETGFEKMRFDQSLTYGAHAAVVRVEESTGKIVVDRLIAVHDVGKVINPLSCRSQIVGGALMGLGQALREDLKLSDGKITNDSLRSYGIPTIDMIDTIETITLENPDPLGPFGVKGIAEAAPLPVAAAVANAIDDAVGVRLTSLPLRLPPARTKDIAKG
jgi:CO/xanthine dehydrogenase Mo-binding subunit/aerobic-type carbon monoxide dehydrogenase small subunit (CoxS/CutS family)